MTRERVFARLAALLEHAKADSAEGAIAVREAAKWRLRHGVEDEEFDAWQASQRREARSLVEVEGWAEPWLFALLAACALIDDCSVGVGAKLVLCVNGARAGKAMRRAEVMRRRIEGLASRQGDAFRSLPVRTWTARVYSPSTFGTITFGGYGFAQVMTEKQTPLDEFCGDLAGDTYRLFLMHRLLGPDIEAARRRGVERQRQAQEAQRVAPPPPPPPEAQRAAPPPPESSPPPPVRDTEVEAFLRRVDKTGNLLSRVLESQPVWAALPLDEPVEPSAIAVVV